jgi:hypothetical protein
MLCLVGVFVALQVGLVLQTYTYRKLSGGNVVALDQPAYQPGPPGNVTPSANRRPRPESLRAAASWLLWCDQRL